MSWLSDFMHPERPYESAKDTMQQYFNQSQGYYQPLIQHGEDAYGNLSDAMHNLLNPEELTKKWMESYDTSPQALQDIEFAKQSGLDAASSMGLMGSSPALQALQQGEAQIKINDRSKYLDDLIQKYITGANIGQNIYNTGATASGSAATNTINMGQTQGGLDAASSQAKGGMMGKLLGLVGNLGINYLTGGMGTGGFGRGAWSPTGGV